MSIPLKILHLEDEPYDAELVQLRLESESIRCTIRWVDNKEDFCRELAATRYDLIFSDYTLPAFNGMEALQLACEKQCETPFLFISGKIGEDVAVESLQNGATDYVLKQNMERLAPAVKRALREVEIRDKRIAAEQALQRSESKYRTLFEESRDLIYITDADGQFSDINPAGIQLLGYDSKQEFLKIEIPEQLYASISEYRELHQRLDGEGFVQDFELTLKTRSGNHLNVLATTTVMRKADGKITGYRGIIRDITQQKKLEQRLLRAQKMEAIGTLAGGIAHDFNNILWIINGNAELCLRNRLLNDQCRENISEIMSATRRAKELVSQMLTFSRRSQPVRTPVPIHTIVLEALLMLKPILPTQITLESDVEDCGYVMGNPDQLHQMIMNLCKNACHAMREGGGTLTVSLKTIDIFPQRDKTRRKLEYAELILRDTGCGMEEAVLKRIFDPFFTTKEVNEGTGLGLSAVHGVVTDMNGEIHVNSQPGKGSDFHILLPVCPVHPSGGVPETTSFPDSTPDGKHILFVDDESEIVDMVQQLLQVAGYKVTGKTNGLDAIKSFFREPEKFSLVITDQTMPGMTGTALAEQLVKVRPDIPVILLSGYFENRSNMQHAPAGIRACLNKPIIFEDLLKTIEHVCKSTDQNTLS